MNRIALAASAVALLVPAAVLAGGGEDLQEAYAGRSAAAKSARDRYALGLWCRANGLLPESAAEFREAARLDPSMEAAREAVGERKVEGAWVSSEEAMERKGLVRHEGRWLLPEEKAALAAPAAAREARAREQARVRKLLETVAAGGEREARIAREALAGVEDGAKVVPMAFALRAGSREVRLLAAAELGRIGDRRALRPLVSRALRDPDEAVRAACLDAALLFRDPEILAPFARALLGAGSPELHAAAAEGIGRIGDVRGVRYLAYAIEGHGGGPRAHIYVASQLSFIQDFDVEVAQTAFIADPMVGILQEGASLDVQVVSNEWYATRIERHAVVGALRRLTGADIGDDPKAWKAWMRDNREKLIAAR